ncbi:hypothetical protein PILCRDRAFT_821646 [Piloderma croceum F 1598]|uniref:Uncharacterized protein n=1 Tax=Piloderma croceum (strain F 1598) TaxID=765440 RepID=A0A0C3B4R9_PILCF|nr:hypothetical protein PILCRDRAFT_821646 [Piloderma croceum F 1598]
MPGDTVRLGDLGLSVGDDTIIINAHLESGINGWLAEHNKFHILAAAITWPRRLDSDFGIIFISKTTRHYKLGMISKDGVGNQSCSFSGHRLLTTMVSLSGEPGLAQIHRYLSSDL